MNADQYMTATADMLAEDYIESVVDEAIIEDMAEEAERDRLDASMDAEYDSEFDPSIRNGYDYSSEILRIRKMAAAVDAVSILAVGEWPDSTGTMRYRYEIAYPDGQIESVSYWLPTTAGEMAEEHGWLWIA